MGRRPSEAVTLADVARRAGVSLATASKAINGRAEVATATRHRVLQAAEATVVPVPTPWPAA